MMNIPALKPINRQGRAVMEAGLDIEDRYVWRFHRAGMLLSDPPSAEHQMGYEDTEHWLTGSPDVVLYDPIKNRPHVVEIKTKYQYAIDEMREGERSFDDAHRFQVLGYVGLTHEESKKRWPDLDPCVQGSIVYGSRDKPSETHEFKFDYDADFMAKGREKLKYWRDSYLEEDLPPRPKEWKWMQAPCNWCQFKPLCKQDVKDGVTKLKDSNVIKHADDTYENGYDYEETRQAVLDRWKVGD